MARGGSKTGDAKTSSSKSPTSTSDRVRDETSRTGSKRNRTAQEQVCLDIFRDALRPDSNDSDILQEVKSHLYNRDFSVAFSKEEYLRVYASRWSPSRGLAYLQIFDDVAKHLFQIGHGIEADQRCPSFRVVSLGGGAGGELVALAAWFNAMMESSPSSDCLNRIQIDLVDMANWTPVVDLLRAGITHPPEISKYASQAKKNANKELLNPEHITINFQQSDVLDSDANSISEIFAGADLVTLMFTLNELYSTSVSKTQRLLSGAMSEMRAGSHLLVVDSPGSYSAVAINDAGKKYPMQWLLEYTLCGPSQNRTDAAARWEQMLSDDSRWFRLPEGLQYPIELENMRYQIHLYRKVR